jgi:hypothetical protein
VGLSRFKATMNVWDASLTEEEEADKLRHFADAHGLVLFFKKGKEYFGAGEDSRMVFARLKNPDDEVADGWIEEANFSAINLNKLVNGEVCQHIFSKDDLDKIKVIDQEEAITSIKKSKSDSDDGSIQIIKIGTDTNRDKAPNFLRTDEE